MFESQRTFDGEGEPVDVSIADLFRSCPNVWTTEQKRRHVFVNQPLASNFLHNIIAGPIDGSAWTWATLEPVWKSFCAGIPSLETFSRSPRAGGTVNNGHISPVMRESHRWYDRYLHSRHWLTVVANALQYYVNCSACGKSSCLNTHHKCLFSYEQCGHERVPRDVSVLCEDCHMLFHAHNHLCVPSRPPSGAEEVLDGEHIHWR